MCQHRINQAEWQGDLRTHEQPLVAPCGQWPADEQERQRREKRHPEKQFEGIYLDAITTMINVTISTRPRWDRHNHRDDQAEQKPD